MPNNVRRARNAASCSTWERGYDGHIFRDQKGRELGRVMRIGRPVRLYTWVTAGCRGSARQLVRAKRTVEEIVRRGLRQGNLFTEGSDAT